MEEMPRGKVWGEGGEVSCPHWAGHPASTSVISSILQCSESLVLEALS